MDSQVSRLCIQMFFACMFPLFLDSSIKFPRYYSHVFPVPFILTYIAKGYVTAAAFSIYIPYFPWLDMDG